jgi:hypothetical protein
MTLRIRNRHIQTVCAVLLLSTVLLGSSCTLLFPGEYRNFWSLNYAESRAYQVRARHVAEGQHISLWLERGESVSPYDLSMILDEFDEAIHPRLSGSFGSPGDIDGNGKVIVLLMDIIDNYGSGNDTYIAGMFLQKDIQPGLFSNQGEMLYLDIYPGLNYSGALDVLLSTAAHEYLHLLDFSAGNYRDLWLAESLATAAEYLYEQGQPEYRTDLFAQGGGDSADQRSISRGNHFLSWDSPALASDYSSAHVFIQWLASTADGGDALFAAIFDSGAADPAGLWDVLDADGGFAGFTNLSDVIRRWHVATSVNAAISAALPEDAAQSADWDSWSGTYSYDAAASRGGLDELVSSPWLFADPTWFDGLSDALLFPGDALYIRNHHRTSDWIPGGFGGNIQWIGLDAGSPGAVSNPASGAAHDILIAFNANPDPDGIGESPGTLPPADGAIPYPSYIPAPLESKTGTRGGSRPIPVPVDVFQ